MNDKELADRVVALGVGHKVSDIHYALYNTNRIGIEMLTDQFINDGRVMLALMEKCSHINAYWDDTGWSCDVVGSFAKRGRGSHDGLVGRTALCPTVIEACCEALEANNGQ